MNGRDIILVPRWRPRAKISIIIDIPLHTSQASADYIRPHIGYYCKFIIGYAEIAATIEKLLKKDVKFQWNEDYQKSLDILKEKMIFAPILGFLGW